MTIPVTYVIRVADIPAETVAAAKRISAAYDQAATRMWRVRDSYKRQFPRRYERHLYDGRTEIMLFTPHDMPYEDMMDRALAVDFLSGLDGVDSIHVEPGQWANLKRIDIQALALEFEELRDFLMAVIPDSEVK